MEILKGDKIMGFVNWFFIIIKLLIYPLALLNLIMLSKCLLIYIKKNGDK